MRYVVSESFEKKEVGQLLFVDGPTRIGAMLRFKSGKTYELVDIEYFSTDLRGTIVQGALKRLKWPTC
jgi:hypothetical protein